MKTHLCIERAPKKAYSDSHSNIITLPKKKNSSNQKFQLIMNWVDDDDDDDQTLKWCSIFLNPRIDSIIIIIVVVIFFSKFFLLFFLIFFISILSIHSFIQPVSQSVSHFSFFHLSVQMLNGKNKKKESISFFSPIPYGLLLKIDILFVE